MGLFIDNATCCCLLHSHHQNVKAMKQQTDVLSTDGLACWLTNLNSNHLLAIERVVFYINNSAINHQSCHRLVAAGLVDQSNVHHHASSSSRIDQLIIIVTMTIGC